MDSWIPATATCLCARSGVNLLSIKEFKPSHKSIFPASVASNPKEPHAEKIRRGDSRSSPMDISQRTRDYLCQRFTRWKNATSFYELSVPDHISESHVLRNTVRAHMSLACTLYRRVSLPIKGKYLLCHFQPHVVALKITSSSKRGLRIFHTCIGSHRTECSKRIGHQFLAAVHEATCY